MINEAPLWVIALFAALAWAALFYMIFKEADHA